MYLNDHRIVITLDAGGTNFVFGAMQAGEFLVSPLTLPSLSNDLDSCINQLFKGFDTIIQSLNDSPVAISFAFPGPADYANGVIGGYLPNFPSFRDGVALGAILEERYKIPVYINNDGDLFAYGEALAGKLPEINNRAKELGSSKQYKSLIGYTFGTGFGIGHVYNNRLHLGDNSCVETFCLPHKLQPSIIVEEGVSVRAIKRVYNERSGSTESLEPKDIFEIAEGKREGDIDAAREAFATLGTVAGDAMATAVTLLDGIIVIGGGITAAGKYIMPSLLAELRSTLSTLGGESVNRVQMEVFNLDDQDEFKAFVSGGSKLLKVHGTDKYVTYNDKKRVGIAFSSIGASKAISLGAYNYALSEIDRS